MSIFIVSSVPKPKELPNIPRFPEWRDSLRQKILDLVNSQTPELTERILQDIREMLKKNPYAKYDVLKIEEIGMPMLSQEKLKMFFACLPQEPAIALSFSMNKFSDNPAAFAAAVTAIHPNIFELNLEDTGLGNIKTATLCMTLRNIHVRELHLMHNDFFVKSGENLALVLASTDAAILHLAENRLHRMGAVNLATALAGVKAQSLYLDGNELGNLQSGLITVCESINSSSVDLSRNFLDIVSPKILAAALAKLRVTTINLSYNGFDKLSNAQLRKIFAPLVNSSRVKQIIVEPEIAARLARIFSREELDPTMMLLNERKTSASVGARARDFLFSKKHVHEPAKLPITSTDENRAADLMGHIIAQLEQRFQSYKEKNAKARRKSRVISLDGELSYEQEPSLNYLRRMMSEVLDANIPIPRISAMLLNFSLEYFLFSLAQPLSSEPRDPQLWFARFNKLLEQLRQHAEQNPNTKHKELILDLIEHAIQAYHAQKDNVQFDPATIQLFIGNLRYFVQANSAAAEPVQVRAGITEAAASSADDPLDSIFAADSMRLLKSLEDKVRNNPAPI
jgi:hypothetical protein